MWARTQPSILYSQILHELGIILRDSRKEPLMPQPIVDLVDHVRRDLAEISPAACREGRSRAARSYLGSISADLGTISGDISAVARGDLGRRRGRDQGVADGEVWTRIAAVAGEHAEVLGTGDAASKHRVISATRCDYLVCDCFVCWRAGTAVAVAADAA